MLEGELALDGPAENADVAIRSVLDGVHRYAQFRLGNREDAEDAAMETWHALRSRPVPFLDVDDRRRYAIGVCRRKWRFWEREPAVETDADDRLMVGRVLAGLADDQREALALKYFHGFSAAEIAKARAVDPNAPERRTP